MRLIEEYQQGAAYINDEEALEIVEYIEQNQIHCPATLYRGVCLGGTLEVGAVINVTDGKYFASWTEEEWVAAEFSKERGAKISAVFQIENESGLPLSDYSSEMEWLVLDKEYEVVDVEECDGYEGEGYSLYTLKIR